MPILSQKYGGDIDFGFKIVIVTHMLSLVTILVFF